MALISIMFIAGPSVFGGPASPTDLPLAPQGFYQETARNFPLPASATSEGLSWVETTDDGAVRVRDESTWFALSASTLEPLSTASPITSRNAERQAVAELQGQEVRQVATGPGGLALAATARGLWQRRGASQWERVRVEDDSGRVWADRDVRGVAISSDGTWWIATPAGVIRKAGDRWSLFTGREGLPYADFTCAAAGADGEVWFGTHRGAIRFDGKEWAYREGPRWLPGNDVRSIAIGPEGRVWFATDKGLGCIARRAMTLAEKAEHYEHEIERFIKRSPFGYTSEVRLGAPGDRTKLVFSDSDNDGLWTAMYGAGQCFAYGATKSPEAKRRAKQVFEALRFLQKVTQGGPHSPPRGFVARTIRPADWPDPNIGRLEADREFQKRDRLWKVYEPRWPRSADGQWFWKGDTSSDELDGHFFFYPAYFDLVADTDAERERVREVVRDLADHLITHDFALVDHDGKPTRWAVFGPRWLNHDPNWFVERGLNSLSILSYLAVAEHVTSDAKYGQAARELIERHGYGANVMNPKTQMGVGSGNQSDDEMAFMCFYNLLRYTKDETWRQKWRFAFYAYHALEQPEMNPFFNFAFAAVGRGQTFENAYGQIPVDPWAGWLEDSMATLRGFPLDRVNWPHHNSHRLDLEPLRRQQATDLADDERSLRAGRINGKVLPVEERHFSHWNTDPWRLDYGGDGRELASGTVFLLPYYMGLYHGFIEKPK